MSVTYPRRVSLWEAARIQARVIGALIMRETETRYGHQKLGIVWMFAEPLMLGAAVALVKLMWGFHLPGDVPVMLYGFVSYLPFYMFRALISRSVGALKSNLTLMFHRNVSLLDVMIARSLLEMATIIGVIAIAVITFGVVVGEWPSKPMTLIAALLLGGLLGHGLGLIVACITAVWEGAERVIHMMTYMILPFSGAMYMLATVSPQYRAILLWFPLPHIHEMARDGQFGTRLVSYYDPWYLIYWVIGANLIGMFALRVVRPKLSVF